MLQLDIMTSMYWPCRKIKNKWEQLHKENLPLLVCLFVCWGVCLFGLMKIKGIADMTESYLKQGQRWAAFAVLRNRKLEIKKKDWGSVGSKETPALSKYMYFQYDAGFGPHHCIVVFDVYNCCTFNYVAVYIIYSTIEYIFRLFFSTYHSTGVWVVFCFGTP